MIEPDSMSPEQWYRLGALLILFFLSAFFSGSETALTALNRIRLKSQAEKGDAKAVRLEKLIADPGRLLSTILVGNNLVNIAASVFAASFLVHMFGDAGEWITIVILTPILLVFSEILPKTYAASHAERVAFRVQGPIAFIMLLLTPVLVVIMRITRFAVWLTGSEKEAGPEVSEDEIRTLITVGEQSGVVAEEKRKMLHGIFELSNLRVRDVMIPRTEVIALEVATPFPQLLQMVQRSRHSRFPVYDGDLDNIVGVIHSKDILRHIDHPSRFQLADECRPPYFVPEAKRVENLLQSFQERKIHLAIVVDEYGGVEGIVTLEDLIEEIIGEVQDEYDLESSEIRPAGENRYLVDAGVSIRTLNLALGLTLSEEDANTLAGFVMKELGEIPSTGQTLRVGPVLFRVTTMESHRIEEVEVTLSSAVPFP